MSDNKTQERVLSTLSDNQKVNLFNAYKKEDQNKDIPLWRRYNAQEAQIQTCSDGCWIFGIAAKMKIERMDFKDKYFVNVWFEGKKSPILYDRLQIVYAKYMTEKEIEYVEKEEQK